MKSYNYHERLWTNEQVEFLINNYKTLSLKELGDGVGKSERAVDKKLRCLGVERSKCIKWTEADDEYLEFNWGIHSINKLSKDLKRSPRAIKRRAVILNLGGCYESGNFLTVSEISDILSICRETIDGWLRQGKLPYRFKRLQKKAYKIVEFKDFHKFLKEHHELWDATRIPYMALGFEDEWLNKKREKDNHMLKQKYNTPWTFTEEEKLIEYCKQGYTEPQIGELMNRTKDAINRKRRTLIKQGRLKNRKELLGGN